MGERVVWRAVGRARKSERPTADRDRDGRDNWARSAAVRRRASRTAGGCGAALCAPNIKQGCQRQPCSLSMLDSLKPIQFGFFGSLGSFFPKKLPKSGCGVKPRIYTFPHVGVRGAEPREGRIPAGCPAPQDRYLSVGMEFIFSARDTSSSSAFFRSFSNRVPSAKSSSVFFITSSAV